jgi:hypothetical protein
MQKTFIVLSDLSFHNSTPIKWISVAFGMENIDKKLLAKSNYGSFIIKTVPRMSFYIPKK